jgi:hypothetical protein
MEQVLDLYQQPYDPQKPVVCFDECSRQILADVREPLEMKPGQVAREDYEYERRGTFNAFVMVEPLSGWRQINLTEQRTKHDFAEQLKELSDKKYPDVEQIVMVLDNLNTHSLASLWAKFEPEEALRIAKRFRLQHTPKHGSWLNMAEIEIAALQTQCLARRCDSFEQAQFEVEAWQTRRNKDRVKINWRFTPAAAREKMPRLYQAKT